MVQYPKPRGPVKWGGYINFRPITLPNNENENVIGTPLRDCLTDYRLRIPEELVFRSLTAACKTHIVLKITSWPSILSDGLVVGSYPYPFMV